MGPQVAGGAVPEWAWNGYVYRQIRRCNRNLLWTNIALLGIVLWLAVASGRYYANFFRGPVPIDRETLQAVKRGNEPWRYYVTINGDRVADLGLREVETRNPRDTTTPEARNLLAALDKAAKKNAKQQGTESGPGAEPAPSDQRGNPDEREIARYSVLSLGGRFLLVKSDGREIGKTVTGTLIRIPHDVSQHLPAAPAFQEQLLPLMLDTSDFRMEGIGGMAIGLPLLLVAVWNIKRALHRRARPETHPIAVILGRRGPFPEVVAAVEHEMADRSMVEQLGKVTLTRSWVFEPLTFGLRQARFEEIVWLYKSVQSTKYYGVVTVSKRYAACIRTRLGSSMDIELNEQTADSLLAAVAARAPWAVHGYDKSIEQVWLRNRPALIQEVDARIARHRQG